MAPCTGLQLIPSTVLRTCSVSLAFSAKAFKVAVRSYKRNRGRAHKEKKLKEHDTELGRICYNTCDVWDGFVAE